MDMQLVRDWATLDFAIFPVGDGLTMGVIDAIRAAKWVGVNKVVVNSYEIERVVMEISSPAIRETRDPDQTHSGGIGLTIPLNVRKITEAPKSG
jgi:hypothetical protein